MYILKNYWDILIIIISWIILKNISLYSMDFQKLQSKYVTNNSKNGQYQNGNSFNKFNTLPNNINQDEFDKLLKVIICNKHYIFIYLYI